MDTKSKSNKLIIIIAVILIMSALLTLAIPSCYKHSLSKRGNIFESSTFAEGIYAHVMLDNYRRGSAEGKTPTEIFYPEVYAKAVEQAAQREKYGYDDNYSPDEDNRLIGYDPDTGIFYDLDTGEEINIDIANTDNQPTAQTDSGISLPAVTAGLDATPPPIPQLQIEYGEADYVGFAEWFDEHFYSREHTLTYYSYGIAYASRQDGRLTGSSGNPDMEQLSVDMSDEWRAYFSNAYRFSAIVEVSPAGGVSIGSYSGISEQGAESLAEFTEHYLTDDYYGNVASMFDWFEIPDGYSRMLRLEGATYSLAVPNQTDGYNRYDGLQSGWYLDYFITDNYVIIYAAVLILCFLAFLVMGIIGFKTRLSERIPLEIAAGLCAAAAVMIMPVGYLFVYVHEHDLSIFGRWIFSGQAKIIITYALDALMLLAAVLMTAMAALSLGRIRRMGLKQYILRGTLTMIIIRWLGRGLRGIWRFLKNNIFGWIARQLKRLYHWVADFDLADPLNRTIVKILAINFVVLTILCVLWLFGIIGLIIYSFVLFAILRHYADDISRNYRALLAATGEIAKGNLTGEINTENMGIFTSFGEELREVQSGFKRAVENEVKSQNMKAELITNVSHDLKTPLTAIITYIDLLKDENITAEERRKYVDTLDSKSQRLKALIENLFEMSKASSGNVSVELSDIDIVALVRQVELEMGHEIEKSGISFIHRQSSDKLVLRLDGEKTSRVIENLYINATKYALEGTRAYVDIREDEDRVTLEIKNISSEPLDFDEEDITERFVRGDRSRNTEGSGLGLAIAKSFMELQGGSLRVHTDGDLFKVTLEFARVG